MIEADKVKHVLRRFAFGASPFDFKTLGKETARATLEGLISAPPNPHSPDTLRFFIDKEETSGAIINDERVSSAWMYELLTTPRPLHEKLAIFWHDHFAVNTDDVADGLMALEHWRLLRGLATKPFGVILGHMAQDPTFMEMLTMRNSTKVHPNENFGRELLELYTLGIGNYTEKDIKEFSRCFTGWTYLNNYYDDDPTNMARLKQVKNRQMGFAGYAFVKAFFDGGTKVLLGKTGAFTGEQALKIAADHPATALHLSRKFWEYFAYTDPEEAVVTALAAVWKKSGGDPIAMVRAIEARPEFYSKRAVQSRIKSPVEFVVGIGRAMNTMAVLPPIAEPSAPWTKQLDEKLWDAIGDPHWHARQAGQNLLQAPTVAGWDWGKGWINSNTMLWRMKFGGVLDWEPKDKERKKWGAGPGGSQMLVSIQAMRPTTVNGVAQAVADQLDVVLTESTVAVLAKIVTSNGGMSPWTDKNSEWQWHQVNMVFDALRSAPEFQLC